MEMQKRKLESGTKVGPQRRFLTLARKADAANTAASAIPGLNVEARTLELSFSSEAPVARWFGNEVLSHDSSAADLTRLNDAAPLLFNHDMDDVIGVVERAWIDGDKKGRSIVRFAKTARGDEILGMVADGILRNVSFMYQASKYRIESDEEDPYYDDDAIYTATRWEAFEISIVSVPADQTVGVGRSLTFEERSVEVEAPKRAASPAASADSQPPGEDPMILKRTLAPLLMSAALADGAAAGGGAAAAAAAVDPVVVERQRYADVTALARKHQVPAETLDKWLAGGTTIHEARGLVLDMKLASQGGPVASLGEGGLGMSDREKRSYSVIRAVQALVTGDWKRAGFEREVSTNLQKQVDAQAAELGIERPNSDARGFMLPLDLPFAPDEKHLRAWRLQGGDRNPQLRAPYQVGTAAQGGNLVATNLLADNFIEVLRNASVTAQLGARYLTDLVGKVDIPRQSAAMTVGWVGESTAGSESEATFDKVSLTPKTVTAWSVMSRLMMLQATPAIEMLAREDLLAVAALALDLAALSGTGSGGQPLGVVNQSGVGSVVGGTNGLAVTFDQIIQLKTLPRVANASIANMAFAINSKTKGYLETQKASTGQYLWTEGGYAGSSAAPNLKGERYVESQQLRSTLTKGTSSGICSELIYGNWRELLIAMWGVLEIGVNPYDSTGFKNGDVILRVMQTLDVGVRHGASFAVMSDALTPGF
jgi:HK97 family phage major capsid protein/HK97 family phage prohead protease